MKAETLLRATAVVSAIFTAGHTMGGLKKWSPMGDNEVLRQMTNIRFETMGVSRSYLNFFMGFGWSLSLAMLLQTVLLWQLAPLVRTHAPLVRPMLGAFILEVFASALIAWRFLFPVPALFALALLVPLSWAYIVAR